MFASIAESSVGAKLGDIYKIALTSYVSYIRSPQEHVQVGSSTRSTQSSLQAIKLTIYYSKKTQVAVLAKGKGTWGSIQESSKHRDSWCPFSAESHGQCLLLPALAHGNMHGVLPARATPQASASRAYAGAHTDTADAMWLTPVSSRCRA